MVARSHKIAVRLIAALIFELASFASIEAQIPSQTRSDRAEAAEEKAVKNVGAQELIKKARQAIGGEDVLNRVQTLYFSGKLRRFVKYASVQSPKKVVEKDKTLSGKVEIYMLLPDRFSKRVSTQTLRGFGVSYVETVNGDRAWRNPPLRAVTSNRDRRVIDVDDFERTIDMQAHGARQQQALYSLGLLLQSTSSLPLEFSYEGQLQTYSGLADVIKAEGPENFQMFLLLDPKTHLPIGVALSFVEVRQQPVIIEAAGYFDRRFTQDTVLRARQERQARTTPQQRYELHLRFFDYRQVGGILWPQSITTTLNGEILEQLNFTECEINRPINPKKFEGQPEPKY